MHNNESLFNYERGYKDINPPIGLFWAGWRTTTIELQHAGWEVIVQDDPSMHMISFGLRHGTDFYGFSNPLSYILLASTERSRFREIDLHVNLGSQAHIMIKQSVVDNWMEIDKPGILHQPDYVKYEDLKVFQPNKPEQEVLAESKDVEDLLQEIINKQKPKQEDIRRRILNEQAKTKVSAQIITLVA